MKTSLRARAIWAILFLGFVIEALSRLFRPLGAESFREVVSLVATVLIIGALLYLFNFVNRLRGVMLMMLVAGAAIVANNVLRLVEGPFRDTGWFILDQGRISHSVTLSMLDWIAVCSTIAAFTWLILKLHESRRLISEQGKSLAREAAERRSAEQRLRQVIDLIPNYMFARDANGRLVFGNAALAEAYGCTVEDMAGKDFRELHADHAEAEVMLSHDRLILERSGDAVTVEEVFTDRHGHRRRMQTTKVPFPIRAGEPPAVLGISTDITALRKEEEARRAWDAQMQHTQKLESLGIMAGGVAHDFNNLLGAIMGNVELARMAMAEQNHGQEPLAEAQRAAERAADLANQLLAYTGKGDVEKEHADLNALVLDMLPLVRATTSPHAQFEQQLARDLPAVEVDPTQIRQVVLNLLTNAAEALNDGKGTITVSTGVRRCDKEALAQMAFGDGAGGGKYTYLRVRDTGVGMDETTQERVLDPFFTTKFTGRGLGMAAVMGIVRSHNGALEIISAPGQGSTITAYFPIDASGAQGPPKLSTEDDTAGAQVREEGRGTILVIDDEAAIRAVAKAGLERSGYRVLAGVDGREGIDLFREHADDVVCVLVDLTMPEVGGAETCKEIRRIRREVPVVLMTGFHESSAREIIADHCLDGFIKKPFKLANLQATIQRAIQARAADEVNILSPGV